MLPWTSRVPDLVWWISDRDLFTKDLLMADDTDSASQTSRGQGLAERFADAVPGVSQHDPERGALRQHTVEFFQSQGRIEGLQGYRLQSSVLDPPSNSWAETTACSVARRSVRRPA